MPSLAPHSGTLGKRLAAHLLRRTTFGATRAEIDAFATKTVNQAVNDLLSPAGFVPPPDPLDPATGRTWVWGNDSSKNSSTGGSGNYLLHTYLSGWYINEAFDGTPPHIAQKMVFFFHTIFATDHHDKRSENQYHQIALFRHYANGSVKSIARKIITDNAMIQFLDSNSNTRFAPNENFSREILELFTILKGPQVGPGDYTNYTEHDIQQAARVFTGIKQRNTWDSSANKDPDTGLVRGEIHTPHHDTGSKTFSQAFGGQTIQGRSTEAGIHQEFDEFIDMVFNKIETAQSYVRRVYRFFVHHNITSDIERDIILPLANTLKNNGYNLIPIISTLLKSKHFYDRDDNNPNDQVIGGIISSPLDFFIKTMRFFKINPPSATADPRKHHHDFYRDTVLRFLLLNMDMDLWSPPSVAGYNAYHQAPAYSKAWVSANTLPFRYKFIDMLYTGKKLLINWSFMHVTFDPVAFVSDPNNISDPRTPSTLVQEILDYVFPESVSANRFDYFKDDLLLDQHSETEWANDWDDYMLLGDDSNIREPIKKLIRGICQAPEFQMM
jgi:uncharacterized protein (DUF1800 family)